MEKEKVRRGARWVNFAQFTLLFVKADDAAMELYYYYYFIVCKPNPMKCKLFIFT